MLKLFIIGLGGFTGSVLRYLITGVFNRLSENALFLCGTLSVNVIGCFLIGFFGGLSEMREMFNPEIRFFVFVGLFGGFTTFSTFGYEIFKLAGSGQVFAAFADLTLHLVLGFCAVFAGFWLSNMLG